jgi:hypothetical protein
MKEIDDVIRAVREEYEPSRTDRERVKRRLLARAAGVGVLASLATKSSLGATVLGGQSMAAVSKLFLTSMVVTFVGAGALVGATRGFSSSTPAPSATAAQGSDARPAAAAAGSVERSASEAQITASPAAPSTPAERSALSASPVPSVALPAHSDARQEDLSLEAELALLREARRSSASGDVASARRVLDTLDLRHPRGALLEERAALRAITDCEASGASARAVDFLRRHPASVYAAKVQKACRNPATSSSAKTPTASFALGQTQ